MKYHIICISETWLTEAKIELLKFSGYKFATSFSRQNRVGGGVCILLQDHIEYAELTEITNMSIEYVVEMCAVKLTNENLIIVSLYWNSREEDVFYDRLNKMLNFVNNKFPRFNVVIGGDFNTDVLKNNPKTMKLLESMLEFRLTQHIKQATHHTATSSTCLDLIFTNLNKTLFYTSIEQLGFSNHSGTILHLKLPKLTHQITWTKTMRLFNSKNVILFKNTLKNID